LKQLKDESEKVHDDYKTAAAGLNEYKDFLLTTYLPWARIVLLVVAAILRGDGLGTTVLGEPSRVSRGEPGCVSAGRNTWGTNATPLAQRYPVLCYRALLCPDVCCAGKNTYCSRRSL